MMTQKQVHEGKLLEQWLINEGYSPEQLGKMLSVKKQTVYYHIGRAKIGDSFKRKLQKLKSNPFDQKVIDDSDDTSLKDQLLNAYMELNDARKELDQAKETIKEWADEFAIKDAEIERLRSILKKHETG